MTTPKSKYKDEIRYIVLCFIFICSSLFSFNACAQQDTAYAFQLLDSAIVVKPNNPKKAKILCEKVLTILESSLSSNDSRLVDPYTTMGNILDDLSQYDRSLEFHNKSLNILQQSPTIEAFTLGGIYNNLGNVHNKKGDYQLSLDFMKKSEAQYRDRPELRYKEKHSKVLGNLGVSYRTIGKIEESLIYQKKAIELLETITDTATINTAINYVNYGVSLGDVGRFNEALESHEAARIILTDLMGENHVYVGYCYNNLGLVATQQGDVELGKEYYIKALNHAIANKEKDLNSVAVSYNNLGVICRKLGDYDKALDYYQKSKNINDQIFKADHMVFGDYYHNIANIYSHQGLYEEAKLNNKKSLDIFHKAIGKNSSKFADVYADIALLELNLGSAELAIEMTNKSIDILIDGFGEDHVFLAGKYGILGQAYIELGLVEEAEEVINKSLDIYLNGDLNGHPDMSGVLSQLARIQVEKKQLRQARNTIQQAFDILGFDVLDITYSARSQVYDTELLNALDALGVLYRKQFQDQNQEYSDSLVLVNKHIFSLNELMIQNAIDPEDKRTILSLAKEQYALAIEDYIILDMHEEAFALSDKMKARTLNASIQKSEYADNFNIPDSIVQLEIRYLSKINKYQQELHQIDYAQPKADSLYELSFNRLFEVKELRDGFYDKLRSDYPAFWNQVYEPQSLEIMEVQSKLTSKQSYLQYFIQNDSSLVVFLITKNDFKSKLIQHNGDLEFDILEVRNLLNSNDSKDNIDAIATSLYDRLMKPFEDDYKFEILISPDGILSLLPFEVLKREQKYLIEDHCVSYHYSTQLWDFMGNKKVRSKKELLSLAPTFDEIDVEETIDQLQRVRSEFGALLYNQEEAKTVAEMWGGEFLSSDRSNLETFLKLAPDYNILHLATHGKADDRKGEYSYLVLKSDHDSVAQKLYVKDLYGLKLSNKLVVLSACETGTGEVQQGEGIMSMAHGFAMAGSQSIVPTLWSINDKASSQIIVDFFQNLKVGQKKNEALRNAKLSYLKNKPDASPFYWAPFIAIGDISPIKQRRPLRSTLTWIGTSFLCLFAFLAYRRRNRNAIKA